VGRSERKKDKYKDVGINEGIIRQRVRVIVDVIATLAFGKLAMTGGGSSAMTFGRW
jgi:hypothetical protein